MIPCRKIPLSEPASTHHETTHRKIQSWKFPHVKLLIGCLFVEDSFWPMQCHDLFASLYNILSTSMCGRCVTQRIAHMSPHLKIFEGFVLEAFLDNNGRMGKSLEVVEVKGTKSRTTFANLIAGWDSLLLTSPYDRRWAQSHQISFGIRVPTVSVALYVRISCPLRWPVPERTRIAPAHWPLAKSTSTKFGKNEISRMLFLVSFPDEPEGRMVIVLSDDHILSGAKPWFGHLFFEWTACKKIWYRVCTSNEQKNAKKNFREPPERRGPAAGR